MSEAVLFLVLDELLLEAHEQDESEVGAGGQLDFQAQKKKQEEECSARLGPKGEFIFIDRITIKMIYIMLL